MRFRSSPVGPPLPKTIRVPSGDQVGLKVHSTPRTPRLRTVLPEPSGLISTKLPELSLKTSFKPSGDQAGSPPADKLSTGPLPSAFITMMGLSRICAEMLEKASLVPSGDQVGWRS